MSIFSFQNCSPAISTSYEKSEISSNSSHTPQSESNNLNDNNINDDNQFEPVDPPPVEQQPSITEICVVGDAGTGLPEQYRVARAMAKENCKSILYTGDIIYEDGAESTQDEQWKTKFEQPFKQLIDNGSIFYAAVGNHDYRPGTSKTILKIHNGYANKNSFYYFPSLYYQFQLGPACIWAVDTNNVSEEQISILKNSMENTNPNCIWKMAFAHHPVVSSGVHGDSGGSIKRKLRPILIDNIDIFFAGHDHHLSDEGFVPDNNGFRQIISGAGAKLRDVKSCQETGCLFSRSILGFVKVLITNNSVTMNFIDENNNTIYTTEMK